MEFFRNGRFSDAKAFLAWIAALAVCCLLSYYSFRTGRWLLGSTLAVLFAYPIAYIAYGQWKTIRKKSSRKP